TAGGNSADPLLPLLTGRLYVSDRAGVLRGPSMARFHKISIDVEEVAVGTLMRLLHTTPCGVKVHCDLDDISHKQPTKPSREGREPTPHQRRGSYKLSGRDALTQILAKADGPLRTGQLREAFADAGRGNSIASVVHAMKGEGLVELTSAGYVLSKKMKD